MNIVVVGVGAVGGYFGGKMAKAGVPVSFLVREKRFHQLQESGLQIKSVHGDFTIQPTLVRKASEVEKPDVVLISVKNYHLNALWDELSELVNKGAKILPLLNGVGHMDLLVQRFGRDNVLGGLCYLESTLDPNGVIVQTSPMQQIVFGSLREPAPAWLQALANELRQDGVQVTVSDSIISDMWQKFIFLVSLSGITAALRQPIGVAVGDPVTKDFLRDLIEEIQNVALQKQVSLPADTVNQLIQRMESLSPDMTSSMHRDLEKGLPMELDSLQGAVLSMAEELGVKVPSIRSIYSLLHPFKSGTKA